MHLHTSTIASCIGTHVSIVTNTSMELLPTPTPSIAPLSDVLPNLVPHESLLDEPPERSSATPEHLQSLETPVAQTVRCSVCFPKVNILQTQKHPNLKTSTPQITVLHEQDGLPVQTLIPMQEQP